MCTGYAGGVDGPVRSLRHHRWPFDIEQQLVFSTLADQDLGAANVGASTEQNGKDFSGGVKAISFPAVTRDNGQQPGIGGSVSGGGERQPVPNRGHTAIITIYEACWFNSWGTTFAKDSGMIMETGDVNVTDAHDFSSIYGEFLATGNDPSVGQLGSIAFEESNFTA